MTSFSKNRCLLLSFRFFLGGIFIYSGWVKILNPQAFADAIATFKILPHELINTLALTLPPFEFMLGILTVLNKKLRAVSYSILILSIIFILALVQALIRGLNIDCGCFGGNFIVTKSLWIPIGRDLLFLIGAILLYHDAGRKPEKKKY